MMADVIYRGNEMMLMISFQKQTLEDYECDIHQRNYNSEFYEALSPGIIVLVAADEKNISTQN